VIADEFDGIASLQICGFRKETAIIDINGVFDGLYAGSDHGQSKRRSTK
jgi:hypothetical protein